MYPIYIYIWIPHDYKTGDNQLQCSKKNKNFSRHFAMLSFFLCILRYFIQQIFKKVWTAIVQLKLQKQIKSFLNFIVFSFLVIKEKLRYFSNIWPVLCKYFLEVIKKICPKRRYKKYFVFWCVRQVTQLKNGRTFFYNN